MSGEARNTMMPRAVVPVTGKQVPVTLVTGYLGAGKTTLVNAILRNKGYRRIAVVENEFGEINIDGSLVTANLIEKEDLVSLTKGCVCCSLRKDICKALRKLYHRSITENKPFDAVLLETTGLADPAPVAFTFFASPWIAERFKLDSILCVVDALFTEKNLSVRPPTHSGPESSKASSSSDDEDPVNEVVQQLAFADTILVNKIDLVGKKQLADVKRMVQKINSTAVLCECQLNKPEVDGKFGLPLEKILDLNAFGLEKALEVDPQFMRFDSDRELDSESMSTISRDTPSTSGQSDYDSDKHSRSRSRPGGLLKRRNILESDENGPKRRRLLMHDTMGIFSVGITAQGPLHPWRFNMFLRDFFVERHKDIFRCKGVLCIKGHENTRFVFQGVHDKLNYGPAKEPWGENEPRINRVVFIGRDLDREGLKEAFRSCVWTPLPQGWTEHYENGQNAPIYRHESGVSQNQMPRLSIPHVEATELETTSQLNHYRRNQRTGVPVP